MLKNLYLFLFFAFHLLSVGNSFAQTVSPPAVKCISVAGNGDVTLSWVIPADPGGNFVAYKIYSSSVSFTGPYTLIGTETTYTQSFFTHTGAGANTQRVYYKVHTEYNPGQTLSFSSDSLSTIFLSAINPGNGTALLNWNKISIGTISTSSNWYRIYREHPAGIWTLLDSTQNLSYTDVIDVCNSVLNYKVEISDNTGCTSISRVDGGSLFTDQTPPVIGKIDTVSVNQATNQATIAWTPSSSPDVDSVVIYQSQPAWIKIATVPATSTFYQYPASNAGTVSELYRIAFVDSCGNISPQGIHHKTMYLSANFDVCATTASLVWNRYINWTPAVTQYQVFKSVNAGALTLIGTNSANDTDYVDTGLILGNSYCYVIRATNGVKTSSSNKTCFIANVTLPPQFNYNRFATVTSDKTIFLTTHVDISAKSVKYYRIQRATGTSGSFSQIKILPPPAQNTLTYTDNSVTTATNSYSYKVDAMDSCQHVVMTSNPSTTILLHGSMAPNLAISLAWSNYSAWPGNVDHYDIYRAVDGVWNSSPIGTILHNSSGGTYTDDISSFFSTSKGAFSYYVRAVEGPGNPFGFTDSSKSNSITVYAYPKIYIPNAFTPNADGLNDIFLPKIGFMSSENYSFTIFDLTGSLIMTTTDLLEGWDGKKRGHVCQEGIYMYLIKCKTPAGDDSKISGTVSLIR